MLRDDLNEPLTGPAVPPGRVALRRAASWVLPIAAASGAVALAAVYAQRPAPSPVAASIPFEAVAVVAPPAPVAPAPAPSVTAPAPPPEAGGVAVVRNGDKAAPARPLPKIIDVAEALGNRLAPAPDRRLTETSKYGALPRIGADGARAAEVYARPFSPIPAMRSAPRIAVFLGGVGLDGETTRAAISRLPGAVSLGVAPYGADLVRVAESARGEGHEIWLQAPMESLAGADPGPHTLKVGASEAENADNLHWLMGRFSGYVGVAGYLGAKFTADAGAFSPVLAEIGRRGLDYFDDGASPLSKADDLAGGLDVKASHADVILETGETAQAALARAEELARRHGAAIVVATALPQTVEALARWVQGLEARGFVLTPLTALTNTRRERAAASVP